jgi:hypothetical protein
LQPIHIFARLEEIFVQAQVIMHKNKSINVEAANIALKMFKEG